MQRVEGVASCKVWRVFRQTGHACGHRETGATSLVPCGIPTSGWRHRCAHASRFPTKLKRRQPTFGAKNKTGEGMRHRAAMVSVEHCACTTP